MKKTLLIPTAAALLGVALFTGCGTDAHYVNSNGTHLVTTVGSINIQDFANAADNMVQSLNDNYISQDKLHSGVAGEPALLAISRIQNETGEQFDTDLLVKKISVALNRTGKIQTSTTYGIGGPADPIAADLQRQQELNQGVGSRRPDYTLSGKIIEVRDNAGDTHQSSFVFQLSLSSNAGVAVWEEEKTITKQGTRPAVGF